MNQFKCGEKAPFSAYYRFIDENGNDTGYNFFVTEDFTLPPLPGKGCHFELNLALTLQEFPELNQRICRFLS